MRQGTHRPLGATRTNLPSECGQGSLSGHSPGSLAPLHNGPLVKGVDWSMNLHSPATDMNSQGIPRIFRVLPRLQQELDATKVLDIRSCDEHFGQILSCKRCWHGRQCRALIWCLWNTCSMLNDRTSYFTISVHFHAINTLVMAT